MPRGKVKGCYAERPYAFIKPDGEPSRDANVFFTADQLEPGVQWEDLFHGMPVEYELETNSRRGPRARIVRVVTDSQG